jgi:hypothetical protein
VAASLKTSFGLFALVGEVNAALQNARFIDGIRIARNMMPMTWQASIAYQFDWNSWIQEIGAQGESYRWDIPAVVGITRACREGRALKQQLILLRK